MNPVSRDERIVKKWRDREWPSVDLLSSFRLANHTQGERNVFLTAQHLCSVIAGPIRLAGTVNVSVAALF